MPDGSVISKDYFAEFNNGTFSGDISGCDGVFSGTLTADAINAVDNITIAGKSVAVTETAYVADTGLIWTDDGVYRDVIKIAIVTPPGDDKGGIYKVLFQFKTIDGKDDNQYFNCQFKITMDSVNVWESAMSIQQMFQYAGQYFSFVSIGNMSYGLHTFCLQYRIFTRPTNAYPRFFNVRAILDYSRK